MAKRVTDEAAWDILATPVTTPVSEIAAKWDVSEQTVRIYKRLENDKARAMAELMRAKGATPWLLPPPDPEEARRGSLTDEQVKEIRASNLTSAAMATKVGCSSSLIRMIRTGRAYV